MRLSSLSWEWGISNFFLEDIPFSLSTGKIFASRIASLIAELKQPDLQIFECGAGMGMLSKHVLDILKVNYPSVYKRVHWTVTEYSKQMVDQWPHKRSRLSIKWMNVLDPHFEPDEKPAVVIMSYLLDSLAARHIDVKKGQLYEIQIRTLIPDNAVILDTTTFPPKILKADDIRDLLQSGNDERVRILAPAFKKWIREERVWVPINQIKNWYPGEKKELETFAATLKSARFNFDYRVGQAIKKIMKQMPEESMMLIHDFGFSRKNAKLHLDRLVSHYGAACFYSVYFPYLRSLTEKSFITKNKEGETQLLVLYKGEHPPKEKFRQLFPNVGYEKIHVLMEKINIRDFDIGHLSSEEKESYYLNIQLAARSLEAGLYEQAIAYAQKTIDSYGSISLAGYLIQGKSFMKMGQIEKAESCFKNILKTSPVFPPAFSELARLYGHQKDYKKSVECAKKYIKYCGDQTIWEHLVTIALMDLELKNTKEAGKIIDWIIKSYPMVSPEPIFRKAEFIKKTFKL